MKRGAIYVLLSDGIRLKNNNHLTIWILGYLVKITSELDDELYLPLNCIVLKQY